MPLVPGIDYEIIYAGKNISEDVSNSIISITYSDNTSDKSDEVELEFDDSDKLWRNSWYPQKKDRISVRIGTEGKFLDCGEFEVDESNQKGPPATFRIKAIAVAISKNIRTKYYRAHESKTLKQIAQFVCDTHGYILDVGTHVATKQINIETDITVITNIQTILNGVIGEYSNTLFTEQSNALMQIAPMVGQLAKSLKSKDFALQGDWAKEGLMWTTKHISNPGIRYYINRLQQITDFLIKFRPPKQNIVISNDLSGILLKRSTQAYETDLEYLSRIAREYGFAFNIKDNSLIFYMLSTLEQRGHSSEFSPSDMITYDITTKTNKTYKSATLKHHNPNTQSVISATANLETSVSNDGKMVSESTSENTLEIKTRVENQQQADAKAKAILHQENKEACKGSFTAPANIQCCGGNNVKLIDLGEDSGVFHIKSSSFTLNKSGGNTVSCEVERVAFLAPADKKLPSIQPKKIDISPSPGQPSLLLAVPTFTGGA